MAYITKQEIVNGKWWTWVLVGTYDTTIAVTDYQIDETEATAIHDSYIDAHLYDDATQVVVSIYENRDVIRNAIVFIKTTNPTLTQWNNYLATLAWDDALAIRWFLAILARELAARNEVDLSEFTEVEVLSKLKTWIINAPARRLEKILFG